MGGGGWWGEGDGGILGGRGWQGRGGRTEDWGSEQNGVIRELSAVLHVHFVGRILTYTDRVNTGKSRAYITVF